MASNRRLARRYTRWMRYEGRVARLFGPIDPIAPLPYAVSRTAAQVARAYSQMRTQRWARRYTGGPW